MVPLAKLCLVITPTLVFSRYHGEVLCFFPSQTPHETENYLVFNKQFNLIKVDSIKTIFTFILFQLDSGLYAKDKKISHSIWIFKRSILPIYNIYLFQNGQYYYTVSPVAFDFLSRIVCNQFKNIWNVSRTRLIAETPKFTFVKRKTST
jgi:hypothetical protein